MKKLKYLLCLSVVAMMILVPNTFAACTHPATAIISTTTTVKIGKSGHCRNLMKIKKCTLCNSVTKILGTTKLAVHTIETKITSAATCNAQGIRRSRCTTCGYSYTTKIPMKKHSLSSYKSNAKKHYKTCSTCSRLFDTESHKFNSNYTCSTCGYKCKHPTISSATCSKDGKCTLCGYVKTTKLGHKLSGFIANGEKGHYRKCTRDGCTYKTLESNHGILDGTCVKCGYAKVCKHANKIFPTCTKAGSCKDCGTIFSKLGHNYVDGVCNRINCNAEEPVKDTGNVEDIVITPSNPGSANQCNHSLKSAVSCLKPSTCIKCGTEFGEPIPHDYDYEEWNIGTEYHYVFCQICWRPDTIKTEKHSFDSNGECTICGYVNGSKIEENVDAPEVLECDHGNSTVTVTIKEPTCIDNGEEEVRCATCNYSKTNVIPKNNFHTYDSAAGYRVTVKYHQVRCTGCGIADSENREEHKFNKEGICTVCEYICRHPSCDEGAACSYCGYSPSGTCTKHKWETKIDDYGHWQTCSECGYQNKDAEAGKYGIHVYATGSVDVGNGKHARICVYCKYKLETVHLWINNECSVCGSNNSTGIQDRYTETREYDPNNDEQLMELQEHLKELGYYNSGIDADWGKGTFNAIDSLLKDQGCKIEINYSEGWKGITPEIYTLLMNCEESAGEATIRQLEPLIQNQTATEEQAIKLAQAKFLDTGYYDGPIDGKMSEDFQIAFANYCKLNNIDLESTTLSLELINSIIKNDETKVQAVERVRRERKEDMKSEVDEMGYVYFLEFTFGQLYENPGYYEYSQPNHPRVSPEWGEPLINKYVDCSYMITYYAHEVAGYYGDTALENWTESYHYTGDWERLCVVIEKKEKIENGEITDEKVISDFYAHYNPEKGTYTIGNMEYPIDSFEIVWSANDGTNPTDYSFNAGDIVLERNRGTNTSLDSIYDNVGNYSGHIEAIMEDGTEKVYTAGGKSQWQNNGKNSAGEYYEYTRTGTSHGDPVYVIRFKAK